MHCQVFLDVKNTQEYTVYKYIYISIYLYTYTDTALYGECVFFSAVKAVSLFYLYLILSLVPFSTLPLIYLSSLAPHSHCIGRLFSPPLPHHALSVNMPFSKFRLWQYCTYLWSPYKKSNKIGRKGIYSNCPVY